MLLTLPLRNELMSKITMQIRTIIIAGLLFFFFRGAAQTTQYVTLYYTGVANHTVNQAVQSNQVITVVGYDWRLQPSLYGTPSSGNPVLNQMNITPYYLGNSNVTCQIPTTITGLTNIALFAQNSSVTFATFQITTPATANVVSNYVPADAIVIPASATGNVQIILETSPI